MSDFCIWLEEKGIIESTEYALEYYSDARWAAIQDIYIPLYLAEVGNRSLDEFGIV